MPTVARFGSTRVVIYPDDHRPAHVHLVGPDGEAVFDLHCPWGPPELRASMGYSLTRINRHARMLQTGLRGLCHHWSAIHGDDC